MMTEEQAWKAHDALVAIRMKIIKMYRSKQGRFRYSISPWPNTFELAVTPYSSVVSGFGFISKDDAVAFLNDPENKQLLMDAFMLNEFKIKK